MGCTNNANGNHREVDIEELNKKYNSLIHRTFDTPTYEDLEKNENLKLVVDTILKRDVDYKVFANLKNLMRKHCLSVKNSYLFQVFLLLKELDTETYTEEEEAYLRQVLQIKAVKSHSGIISVTVFTSGNPEYTDPKTGELKKQQWSCKWSCHYCPTEPGQPKSYLSGEPGVMRANRHNFVCTTQMYERMKALYLIGHVCDKLECLVLGGSWTSYPIPYREQFVRDIYYAANTFFDWFAQGEVREKLTLQEEKDINKTARCKVIGLTLETRPDTITAKELKLLRYYGCTRVQLGIQHIDNDVLKTINRQCKTETAIKGIKLLKDAGYKIDGHFMPNLPGTTIEKDRNMILTQLLGVQRLERRVSESGEVYETYDLVNPSIQVDQWKVYPTTIVPYTDIEKWFKEGTYVPYEQEKIKELLYEMKTKMLPWIRTNRIVRDIPDDYSLVTTYKSNLHQDLLAELKLQGKHCMCIRSREVKRAQFSVDEVVLVVREYNASEGKEYFISFESQDNLTLYGFIRLRLTNNQPIHIFPELEGCALIRELHVYGVLQRVGTQGAHVQHSGLGKRLVQKAESIAVSNGFAKISVIAGEGTRGYYEKLGFADDNGEGHFMIKPMTC
jgi:ELP3 family radical SAM enzyme/protein acetyltransferase